MTDRFLTLEELYARQGGETRVLAFARGENPTARVIAAKQAAENEAHSYLSRPYGHRLPSTPEQAPPVLKDMVASAAMFWLAKQNHELVGDDIRSDYREVVQWYLRVVNGQVRLGLEPTVPHRHDGDLTILASHTEADGVFFGPNSDLKNW